MKLVRYGAPGAEKPGLIDQDGRLRDLSAHAPDFGGATLTLAALDRIRALAPEDLDPVEGAPRLGACVAFAPSFHCVGLNYAAHAAESGARPPKEPILFSKASSALSGPNDPVIRPKGSEKLDYEVELGVVIGADVRHISEADALGAVAGYCVVNDVSERAWQLEHGGQWVKGKSAPSFGPTGPWLVTADEIADPQALNLSLSVNGEMRQSSSTSDMIFSVAEIISYMSRFMALAPGDVIATGTPAGVAMGFSPPRWLAPGDEMRLSVDALGEQRQRVVAFPG